MLRTGTGLHRLVGHAGLLTTVALATGSAVPAGAVCAGSDDVAVATGVSLGWVVGCSPSATGATDVGVVGDVVVAVGVPGASDSPRGSRPWR